MWRRIGLSCLLLMLAVFPARAEWTEDARLCAEIEGDSDRAILHCTQAIESGQLEKEELSLTFSNRAYEYRNKGDFDQALIDANTAIGLDPENYRGWNERGRIYYQREDFDKAIADFEQALTRHSSLETTTTVGLEIDVSANYNLGLCHEKKGDRARAREYFARAHALAPNASVLQNKFREYGLVE